MSSATTTMIVQKPRILRALFEFKFKHTAVATNRALRSAARSKGVRNGGDACHCINMRVL